jgi:hypothetical protein
MKSATFYCFIFAVLVGNAQIQRHHQTLDKKGNLSLLLTNRLQQTMAWGGTSNMAGNFINYDFNYKRRCSLG